MAKIDGVDDINEVGVINNSEGTDEVDGVDMGNGSTSLSDNADEDHVEVGEKVHEIPAAM